MFIGFHAKAQGESHKENNIPCQDSSSYLLSKNNKFGIAVVADGHGGEKYFRSEKGSKFAVEISIQVLRLFVEQLKGEKNVMPHLKQIASNIIFQWRKNILEDIHNNPLNEDEHKLCSEKNIKISNDDDLVSIYGTTLIIAFVTEICIFAIQIGDGTCIVISKDGEAKIAIPEDDRLAFGKTTSLCNPDAIDNFRYIFIREKVLGVTVATDGVSDSFIPEKYLEFNINLMEDFVKSEDAQEKLKNFLPELSKRGSRDDVAIAGIFNKIECKKYIYRKKKESEVRINIENKKQLLRS